MEMKSLYGELAVSLLCGQAERTQPNTQVTSYGRNSARPERNDYSLTASPGTTRLGGHQYIHKLHQHIGRQSKYRANSEAKYPKKHVPS
ncbi:MAG: hypothetical protein HT580_10425 [Dechloromonas sp.]|nr:MAG: hypothetical protein HT580_10425 [Dechloromonas sp.]